MGVVFLFCFVLFLQRYLFLFPQLGVLSGEEGVRMVRGGGLVGRGWCWWVGGELVGRGGVGWLGLEGGLDGRGVG